MGNSFTGDTSRLIAFRGLGAADSPKFYVFATPLFGEADHAR